MGKRRLVIVDLDGTLVKGNTLHQYLCIGMFHSLTHRRYLSGIKIAGIGLLRALRLISHKQFKFRALALITPDAALQNQFRKRINSMINQDVERLLKEMREDGMTILLVTAAADIYIPWIWDGEYIASDSALHIEMRGERKLQEVKRYMDRNGVELYAVITDHSDDLPLLRAGAKKNILVNPSRKTLKLCDMDYEII